MAGSDLAKVPPRQSVIAQTGDRRHVDFFDLRLNASRAPDPDAESCVSLGGFEISKEIESSGQSVAGPDHDT
jgi:hypothetical protein